MGKWLQKSKRILAAVMCGVMLLGEMPVYAQNAEFAVPESVVTSEETAATEEIVAEDVTVTTEEAGMLEETVQDEDNAATGAAEYVILNCEELLLKKGETSKLIATVSPAAIVVTWSSNNEPVATVNQNGEVTAVKPGEAVITATAPDGTSASCNVTVEAKEFIWLDRETLLLKEDQSSTLVATVSPAAIAVTWSSDNEQVATVNQNGKVTAGIPGEAVITAATPDGTSTNCIVTVKEKQRVRFEQAELTIKEDQVKSLGAIATPAGTPVSFHSSDESVAVVDENGNVTAKVPGTAVITAETPEGASATCTITVKEKQRVRLDKSEVRIKNGLSAKVFATATPAGTPVSFVSADESIAKINEFGRIITVSPGQTVIYAVTPEGANAGCLVTVTNEPLTKEEQVGLFVERMYTIVLEREPDESGQADWANGLLEIRVDGATVVNGFVNSPEFVARNVDDSEYIKILYRAILNREPRADEVDSWLRALAQGQNRQDLLDGFIASQEFRALCNRYGILPVLTQEGMVRYFVTRMYTVALSRDADEGGLTYWADKLLCGAADGRDLADGFINSAEFAARNLSNEDYIKTLYRAFLNREADQAGLNSWMSAFAQGYGRADILNAFIATEEFGALCDTYGISAILTQEDRVRNFVTRMYTVALNREADANGLNDWVRGLVNGLIKGAEVAEGFIMSPEFAARGLSNVDYVKTLYRTFFNREASDGDIASWVSAMEAYGQSRRDVLKGFVNSGEFGTLCNNYGIIQGQMR